VHRFLLDRATIRFSGPPFTTADRDALCKPIGQIAECPKGVNYGSRVAFHEPRKLEGGEALYGLQALRPHYHNAMTRLKDDTAVSRHDMISSKSSRRGDPDD
jgi:hypothetical protein